ncbi:MAG: ABATE domain-containing protein [Promethearchaeati archaeon SRVP18_Atabeyarchaeia-1]
MNEEETGAGNLKLIGGWLCLDFTNTVSWRGTDHSHESLNSYSELISWSQHAGILRDDEAQELLQSARLRPTEATAVLKRATALREVIYHVFSAIVDGNPPHAEDLATLNTELSEAMAHSQIRPESGGFAWILDTKANELGRVLWSIARSAADLLTSKEINRIRRCSSKDCGWLFLDMSRNRTRRWCDMKDCGNRAKARRHYERKRALA